MKNALVLVVVLTTCVLFPGRGWTGGMHFGGGYSSGHFGGGYSGSYFGGGHSHSHFSGGQFSSGSLHFGGGMYRNFGSPGPYTNYGSPAFRSPGFGRPPYCPYPQRFGSQYSFRQGVPFFSSGFSSQRFVYRQRLSPAGSPPVSAPGPTPYVSATLRKAPTSFYCVEHAFRYTDQNAFFGHLNFAHKVPLKHAAAYCQQVENGLIFSGN